MSCSVQSVERPRGVAVDFTYHRSISASLKDSTVSAKDGPVLAPVTVAVLNLKLPPTVPSYEINSFFLCAS